MSPGSFPSPNEDNVESSRDTFQPKFQTELSLKKVTPVRPRTRESNRGKNIILPDGGAITKKEAFQKLIFFLESSLYVTSGNNNTQKIVYLLVIYFTATEWVLFDLDIFISWLLGHRQDKTVLLKTKVTHSFYIKIASVNCFMNDGKYGMHFNAKKRRDNFVIKKWLFNPYLST